MKFNDIQTRRLDYLDLPYTLIFLRYHFKPFGLTLSLSSRAERQRSKEKEPNLIHPVIAASLWPLTKIGLDYLPYTVHFWFLSSFRIANDLFNK